MLITSRVIQYNKVPFLSILETRPEILQRKFGSFLAMVFQVKLPLRFSDLYAFTAMILCSKAYSAF